MRKLRRPGHGSENGRPRRRCGSQWHFVGHRGGRPGEGGAGQSFNLHTIVRLPNGVFSPYTPIPTNVLFFDRSGPTENVWCHEHPLPAGRKNYTKTQPLQFEEFEPLLQWWNSRTETDKAWLASKDEIVAGGYNLDLKNPRAQPELEHLPPPNWFLTSLNTKSASRRSWRRSEHSWRV